VCHGNKKAASTTHEVPILPPPMKSRSFNHP
jgi:hypothetical protein